MRPSAHRAVMASRREPPDSLDFFPTPPWGTRALLEHVIGPSKGDLTCWEPACGEGHMAAVLEEYFGIVFASDVFDYGYGRTGSFIGQGADVVPSPADTGWCQPDWIITNPPFNKGIEFAQRALGEAKAGVALLMPTRGLEGLGRYDAVFRDTPPTRVAVFVERLPIHRGRWDPDGDTATAYAWYVWRKPLDGTTRLVWIPPGRREALTRSDDRERFARPAIPVVTDDGLIVPGDPAWNGWA